MPLNATTWATIVSDTESFFASVGVIKHNPDAESQYDCDCHDCLSWLDSEARAEIAAEAAAQRFYEEGTSAQQDQYRWEVEQDERNAAFWSGRGY